MSNRVTAEAFKIKRVKANDLHFCIAFLYQAINSDFGFAKEYKIAFENLGKEIEALNFDDIKNLFKDGIIDIDQTDFYFFENDMLVYLDYLKANKNKDINMYRNFPNLFTDIMQVSFDQGGLVILQCYGLQIYELYTAAGKYIEGPCHDLDLLDKNRFLYRSSGFSPGFILEEYRLNDCPMTLNTYGDFDMPGCPNIAGRDRITIPYENALAERIENFEVPKNRMDVLSILDDCNWVTSPELVQYYYNDKELALKAVQKDMLAYTLLDSQLKEDKEIILMLVKANGIALDFTSESFKADKEVVMAAVTQYGCALEFASEKLKADKEVVIAAVSESKYALEYASKELKTDKEISNIVNNNTEF
jgi:hypothetical protein